MNPIKSEDELRKTDTQIMHDIDEILYGEHEQPYSKGDKLLMLIRNRELSLTRQHEKELVEARIDELERVVVESDSNKMTIYAMQRRTELSEELSNE